jgi:mono/diheme cytochrome c family protein
MTTKQAIHEIVERLSEEEAEQLLAYLREEEPDEYPAELLERIAQAKAEIARGDFVTQEEFERKYMR